MPFVPNPTWPIFTRTPLEALDGVRQGTFSSIFSSEDAFFWLMVTFEEGVESGLAFPDGTIGEPLMVKPPRVGLVLLEKVERLTFTSPSSTTWTLVGFLSAVGVCSKWRSSLFPSSSKKAFNPDGDHGYSVLLGVMPPIPKLNVCSMLGVRGCNALFFVPGVVPVRSF
jgi:hypothetical protein